MWCPIVPKINSIGLSLGHCPVLWGVDGLPIGVAKKLPAA
jgi:hypothetical protein